MTSISTHLFRAVQCIWILALLGLFTPIMIRNHGLTPLGCVYVASFVGYAAATLGIFRDSRWAWVVSIGFLVAYWVFRGWIGLANLVVNSYMFLTGHELYQDSPATIIVVILNALFGVVPGTTLLILGFLSRRHIVGALMRRRGEVAQQPPSPRTKPGAAGRNMINSGAGIAPGEADVR